MGVLSTRDLPKRVSGLGETRLISLFFVAPIDKKSRLERMMTMTIKLLVINCRDRLQGGAKIYT